MLAAVGLFIKIAPTLASHAAGHSTTYRSRAARRAATRDAAMTAEDFIGTPDARSSPRWTRRSPGRKAGSSRCPGSRSRSRRAAAQTDAAGRLARRTERAYWYLRKLLRLHAALPPARAVARGLAEVRRGREPTASRTSPPTRISSSAASRPTRGTTSSRELARQLPAAALRALVKVHGARSASIATRPTCAGVADALMAHELARVIADQARARSRCRGSRTRSRTTRSSPCWAKPIPAALHRLGTLAEATRAARADHAARGRARRAEREARRRSTRCWCSSR